MSSQTHQNSHKQSIWRVNHNLSKLVIKLLFSFLGQKPDIVLGVMMKKYYFLNEDDDYFNDYADTVKYDLLKDRLHWQHEVRKAIYLEYHFSDDECDFD